MANWNNQSYALHSNLKSFIDHTTPRIPSTFIPKEKTQDVNSLWLPLDKETIEYFTLEKLWNHYSEWSAYGAGVPLLLDNGETVIQYYVPYLSALQIYTSKSLVPFRNLNLKEESDLGEFESDSWTDDSDYEELSRSLSNNSIRAWDATSDDITFDQEGVWPARARIGDLYCQYFENSVPHGRIPLVDKINELARRYTGLMSLSSVNLSPASWMAVAWYPIYHIPTGRSVKDLSASFLTYHTLSSFFQDEITEEGPIEDCSSNGIDRASKKLDDGGIISLAPFGLATYKMNFTFWINPEGNDYDLFDSLSSAADSWLKQLRVQHHDFSYFISHTT